jgi:hypothetical protein
MSKLLLTKGYNQYGAQMGRSSVLPDDELVFCKLRLQKINLDTGGYDQGGAYWGLPNNVYWAWEDGGSIELAVRAANWEEAKLKVIVKMPNAKFFR